MFSKLPELIQKAETISYIGKIENVIGMAMESSGNRASIGDIAMIYNEEKHRQIPVEVVGFRGDKMQLMAYENLNGVSAGSFVRNTRKRLKIPVGEFLRGRIIDATGKPMDDLGPLPSSRYYYVENTYINPLTRPPITDPLEFGVKAIDGLNTVGKGQRIGIFAGSGVGKSTLLGMIARNVKADINVIALVGERGREVREFIEKDLGPEGMKRCSVAQYPCGCDVRSAGYAAYEVPVGGYDHSGVFQRPGEGRSADDGFPYPICNGAARDWACYRRAAGGKRIYTFYLRRVPEASGAKREV